MKKITILTGGLDGGGAEKICVLLCNELCSRGYRIDLWSLHDSKKNILLNSQINKTILNKKYSRSSLFKLFSMIKSNNPKLIIAFSPQLAVLLLFIRLLRRNKFVVIGRAINTLSHEYIYKKSIWTKYVVNNLIKYFFQSSDAIIAQCDGMRNDLIDNYSISSKKIVRIYNPAILNQISTKPYVKYSKRHEIIFVGRFESQKGLEYLFNAFSLSVNKDSSLILRMIGEGSIKKDLIILAKKLNINKNLIFEGNKQNLYEYYCKAKATVLTSIYEGMPNVLLESLRAGTPIISFDSPHGPREIVIDGINGYLVPYLNIKIFSEKILEATGSNNFSSKKIIDSSKKFSVNNIVDQYEELINNQFHLIN
ncbi:MAG: hypothetical protein CMG74_13215 [Candidatus Marinimicrobia bacterium]|nr:hypothetical protein [Candidatus Neomarinimicrobiota bacterium]|tara:strand:+ start:70864 stop:71961 length:1098 start_codon:yes stop_codon:yes gene_type:complete